MSQEQPDAGRIFTKEELQEFSKDCMQLALEAIEAGDLEKAGFWCKREAETKNIIHDLYMHWVAALLSYIYDKLGEDAVVEVTSQELAPRACNKEFLDEKKRVIEENGIKGWVNWCVGMARQHACHPGLTVDEDDEKIIIKLNPCGSGGRMLDAGYRTLRKAGPHTWGESDVPIYCGHCAWAHEILPIKIAGQGSQLWVHPLPFPKKPGDPCIHYIYKNPKDIPAKYYERLGLKKETEQV